jgi:SAM-dependent methyltransferase
VTLGFHMRKPIPPAEVIFGEASILTSPGVVMTPVPTTEALVDWAVEWIGSRSACVADVGTGSGAVAIAVALRAPGAQIWATDDREAAVALARANVARHGLDGQVEVLLGDLLEPVLGRLDLVVANLPYQAEAPFRGSAESACCEPSARPAPRGDGDQSGRGSGVPSGRGHGRKEAQMERLAILARLEDAPDGQRRDGDFAMPPPRSMTVSSGFPGPLTPARAGRSERT